MDSDKILMVTPRYAPARCGLGDFTSQLATQWRRKGKAVLVVTSGLHEQADDVEKVLRFGAWSRDVVASIARLVSREAFSHVLFQYSPMGYSRKGAWPQAARIPKAIKEVSPSTQVITTLHEVYYFFRVNELRRIPRNLTVGTCQRILLRSVLQWSDQVVVTTEERLRTVKAFTKLTGLSPRPAITA